MIIFIYGDDTYSAMKQLEAMRDRFKEKFDPSGINISTFKDVFPIGEVTQAIQSQGFLSSRRMVILRDLIADEVTKKEDALPWIDVLKQAPEDSIVILCDRISEKKAKANYLVKEMVKQGAHVYAYEPMTGSALKQWVATEAKRLRVDISGSYIDLLVALVGSDLWGLSSELNKLAGYANGAPVTREMIDLLVKANFNDAVFALMDAISNKNSRQALKLLYEQRLFGSDDFQLTGMLVRQVRLLATMAQLLLQNPRLTKQEAAGMLGVHPFVAQKTLEHARRFSYDQLRAVHQLFFEFDRAVKIGKMDIDVALDRTVVEMLRS